MTAYVIRYTFRTRPSKLVPFGFTRTAHPILALDEHQRDIVVKGLRSQGVNDITVTPYEPGSGPTTVRSGQPATATVSGPQPGAYGRVDTGGNA